VYIKNATTKTAKTTNWLDTNCTTWKSRSKNMVAM